MLKTKKWEVAEYFFVPFMDEGVFLYYHHIQKALENKD
jgi:hypothetical protein